MWNKLIPSIRIGKDMRSMTKNTQSKKKFRLLAIIGIVVITVGVFCGLQFYRGHKALVLMEKQKKELLKQIEYKKFEKSRLTAILENLNSEAYIERVAREELGLVKKGEILIITVDEKENI